MITQNRRQGLALSPRHTIATAHGATIDATGPDMVPEWMTEAWKHRVEAEARHRLKRDIRGISVRR